MCHLSFKISSGETWIICLILMKRDMFLLQKNKQIRLLNQVRYFSSHLGLVNFIPVSLKSCLKRFWRHCERQEKFGRINIVPTYLPWKVRKKKKREKKEQRNYWPVNLSLIPRKKNLEQSMKTPNWKRWVVINIDLRTNHVKTT